MVLESPADPTEDELAAYYGANIEEFTPRPRVKLDGVFLVDRDTAVDFKEKLDAGAQLGWLADRTEGIQDPEPEIFIDHLEASVFDELGIELKKGAILGPFVIREAWAVAKVLDLEVVEPTPLDRCADKVRMAVKGERMKEVVGSALEQLEMQSEIEIEKDAMHRISDRLDEWLSS